MFTFSFLTLEFVVTARIEKKDITTHITFVVVGKTSLCEQI